MFDPAGALDAHRRDQDPQAARRRVDGLPGDLGGESKTDHLIRHLQAQNLNPADVLMIGDALAAAAVGAPCILVATGAMSRSALEATGVPVADTITEAMRYVEPA